MQSIIPEALKPFLGNLLIVRPVYPTDYQDIRFLVKIHGTNLVARAGYNLDGKYLEEIPNPEFRALAINTFANVMKTSQPLLTIRRRIIGEDFIKYASLFLPFTDDGAVSRVLAYIMYLDEVDLNEACTPARERKF